MLLLVNRVCVWTSAANNASSSSSKQLISNLCLARRQEENYQRGEVIWSRIPNAKSSDIQAKLVAFSITLWRCMLQGRWCWWWAWIRRNKWGGVGLLKWMVTKNKRMQKLCTTFCNACKALSPPSFIPCMPARPWGQPLSRQECLLVHSLVPSVVVVVVVVQLSRLLAMVLLFTALLWYVPIYCRPSFFHSKLSSARDRRRDHASQVVK